MVTRQSERTACCAVSATEYRGAVLALSKCRLFTMAYFASPNERFLVANRSGFDSTTAGRCWNFLRNVREVLQSPCNTNILQISLFSVFCQILEHLQVYCVQTCLRFQIRTPPPILVRFQREYVRSKATTEPRCLKLK